MGSCLSKKRKIPPSISSTRAPDPTTCCNTSNPISRPQELRPAGAADLKLNNIKKSEQENGEQREDQKINEHPLKKKEVFVIKHRNSHEGRERVAPVLSPEEGIVSSSSCEILESGPVGEGLKVGVVRTSSCTKEEVDAILIQCGRLSRSSSGKATGRKYSGSKRSYDFDQCDKDGVNSSGNYGDDNEDRKTPSSIDIDDMGTPAEKRQNQRSRHHHSSRPSSSQGRRRTPSRERDQNQRSSSRERRVSRSPGRRTAETSVSNASNNTSSDNANAANNGSSCTRPAKMVSVPATVPHMEIEKSNNGTGGCGVNDSATATTVKRITVKRNVGEATVVGGSRIASSPRSQSPARTGATVKVSDENQQQPQSLSRSSSRKAEQSPYRRNPLSEIDPNSQAYQQTHNNRSHSRSKKETESEAFAKDSIYGLNQKQKTDLKCSNKVISVQVDTCTTAGVNTTTRGSNSTIQLEKTADGPKWKAQLTSTSSLVNTEVVVVEQQKPLALTRSRSARQSRELDINPEALLNPSQTPSYTKMLLQDIQNFHQKNSSTVSLPACVTKACSIVEAVADLNSATSSNFSCAFSEDRRNDYNVSYSGDGITKGRLEVREPFVEAEVAMDDDIMEPSFHKYVTLRRGGDLVAAGGGDMDDQESSGSNSFIGGVQQQHWGISTASWEPNSADSSDSWTSRQNTREKGHPDNGSRKTSRSNPAMTERKRDSDSHRSGGIGRSGIGRGRLGSGSKVLQTTPIVAATAST